MFCLLLTLSSGFPVADSEKCSLYSVLERQMRSLEVILQLFFRLFTKVFPQPLSLNKLVVHGHFSSHSYFYHDWCPTLSFAKEVNTNIVADFPILLFKFPWAISTCQFLYHIFPSLFPSILWTYFRVTF